MWLWLFGIGVVMSFLGHMSVEVYLWNSGMCRCCGSPWECCGTYSSVERVYRCKCGRVITIHWPIYS